MLSGRERHRPQGPVSTEYVHVFTVDLSLPAVTVIDLAEDRSPVRCYIVLVIQLIGGIGAQMDLIFLRLAAEGNSIACKILA